MEDIEQIIRREITDYPWRILDGKETACEWVKLSCKRFIDFLHRDDMYFDVDEVKRTIKFFSHFKHFVGQYADKPFLLEEWQKFIMCGVYGFRWKENNLRVTKTFILSVGRKNGKALRLDTNIPTPTGYTTMGELKEGDIVFDKDGKQTKVIATTPIMYNHKCYEITFTDGEKIVADADHQWWIDRRHKRKYHIETTQDMVDKGFKHIRKNGYTDCYLNVPLAKPLEYDEQELPFDPYTFGVWLGDGCSKGSILTLNGDDMNEILSYIPYHPTSITQEKDRNCFRIKFSTRDWKKSELSTFLKKYNLRGNKHIPKEFLYNSYENRLALLQGLMDTDGYISTNKLNGSHQCQIVQKNDDIANGICFLLNSFGIKYNCTKKIPKIYEKECNEVNVISFNPTQEIPCFRLKRKYNLLPSNHGKYKAKYIKDIKEVDSVPVKCIMVDSPSHTYLCGERNTVTHNSSLVSVMAIKALLETKGAQVICSANSASQANLLQTMASNYLKSLGKKSDKLFRRYRDRIMFPKTESYIKVVSNSPERLDGLNCNFFVADETSQAVDSKVWDVLDTSRGSRLESLAVACTTRSSNQSGFYRELETSAMNVLNGTVDDDTIFAMIYTLDDGDDYENEKVWKKCSPNLDISVYSQFYRDQINKIKTTPSMTSAIMEKVFNVWTSSSNVWIPMDYVYKSMEKVDIKDYKDYLCYLSYDLASTSDLSCVTALFNVDDKFIFKTWYFLPRETLKTSVNKEKYKLWERQKYLIVTEGNVTDYDYIFNQIMKINHECEGVIRISYDTWNSTSLAIKLTEEGYNMQPYSQSIGSMNLPTKQLERLIMQGTNIIIDKNPITAWCFGNAVAKSDWNDNQKIIKESYDNKIDGVVSMIMGYGGYMQDSNYGNITLEGVSFS